MVFLKSENAVSHFLKILDHGAAVDWLDPPPQNVANLYPFARSPSIIGRVASRAYRLSARGFR